MPNRQSSVLRLLITKTRVADVPPKGIGTLWSARKLPLQDLPIPPVDGADTIWAGLWPWGHPWVNTARLFPHAATDAAGRPIVFMNRFGASIGLPTQSQDHTQMRGAPEVYLSAAYGAGLRSRLMPAPADKRRSIMSLMDRIGSAGLERIRILMVGPTVFSERPSGLLPTRDEPGRSPALQKHAILTNRQTGAATAHIPEVTDSSPGFMENVAASVAADVVIGMAVPQLRWLNVGRKALAPGTTLALGSGGPSKPNRRPQTASPASDEADKKEN